MNSINMLVQMFLLLVETLTFLPGLKYFNVSFNSK